MATVVPETASTQHRASAVVRILHLEDDPYDTELAAEWLRAGGLEFEIRRVDTGEEFFSAIHKGGFDLILADYRLPGFDGLTALALAHERVPHIPFILFAGTVGEEFAVETLKLGATDFVLKEQPLRLVSSIQRALREATEREARRRAEEKAAAASRRYRVLYDENPSIYFTLNPQGAILSVNSFGAQQLGYTREQLVGRPFSELYFDADRQTGSQFLAKALAQPDELHRWELRKVKQNGQVLWMRETARLTSGEDGNQVVLIVAEDTTDAWKLSEELRYHATHDTLTGLANRREFERHLTALIDEVRREERQHSLCYLDLDQFKVINDTCGHLAGDELLRQLAARLRTVFRKHDIVARLGGDEFAVIMEYCPLEQAIRAAEQLRDSVRAFRFIWEGKPFAIGVSIGLVAINSRSPGLQEIMSAADAAFYMAKDSGGNRIQIYNEADHATAQRFGEMHWVPRLTEAFAEQRFFLVYQKIASIQEDVDPREHFELLIRLRDRDDRIVLPGEFLSAAERYNLSGTVDYWVVTNTLEWLSGQMARLGRIALCSINLSGRSVGDAEFLERLEALLDKANVPPEKLCFEITETAAITNMEHALRFIHALRIRGCKFALDDFGSGMSSFAYLKNLPVDYVKIDGMFVRDILEDPFDFAMVKAIRETARAGGKRTVAECVENEKILSALRAIGIDYAQGHGIASPLPLSEFDAAALPHAAN